MNIYPAVFRTLRPLSEKGTVTIERREEKIDDYGVVTTDVQIFYDVTAIVVASPNQLDRQPEYQTINNSIEVTTDFPLRGASVDGYSSYQPDKVTWHGGNYIVTSAIDLSKGGLGFVKAICSAIDPVDSPPMDDTNMDRNG